jgi:GntR family transcriptional regulator
MRGDEVGDEDRGSAREPGAGADRGTSLTATVFSILQDGILSNRYPQGAVLPAEEKLAQMFGVSRVTIRAALARLAERGLVARRQGRGTFVLEQKSHPRVSAPLDDLLGHIRKISATTRVVVHEYAKTLAPDDVWQVLGGARESEYLRIVRVRYADDKPLLYVTAYVVLDGAAAPMRETLEREPLHKALADGGRRVVSGRQRIDAVLSDPIVAPLLDIDVGAPLIRVRHVHVAADGKPVATLEILASPTRFELRSPLGGSHFGE